MDNNLDVHKCDTSALLTHTWLSAVDTVPADGARTIVTPLSTVQCVIAGARAVVGTRLSVHHAPVDECLTQIARVSGVRTIARGVAS